MEIYIINYNCMCDKSVGVNTFLQLTEKSQDQVYLVAVQELSIVSQNLHQQMELHFFSEHFYGFLVCWWLES